MLIKATLVWKATSLTGFEQFYIAGLVKDATSEDWKIVIPWFEDGESSSAPLERAILVA